MATKRIDGNVLDAFVSRNNQGSNIKSVTGQILTNETNISTNTSNISSNSSSISTLQTTKQDVITGGASSITSSNLSINRVLISDNNGKVGVSNTTTSTLGYLDATSSIQTQLNGKQNTITSASNIGMNNLTCAGNIIQNNSGVTNNLYGKTTIGNSTDSRGVLTNNFTSTATKSNDTDITDTNRAFANDNVSTSTTNNMISSVCLQLAPTLGLTAGRAIGDIMLIREALTTASFMFSAFQGNSYRDLMKIAFGTSFIRGSLNIGSNSTSINDTLQVQGTTMIANNLRMNNVSPVPITPTSNDVITWGANAVNYWTSSVNVRTDTSSNITHKVDTTIQTGNLYSNNLLLQGNGTHAYIKPTNVNSNLYLGAGNTNYMTISYDGNVNTTKNTKRILLYPSSGPGAYTSLTASGDNLIISQDINTALNPLVLGVHNATALRLDTSFNATFNGPIYSNNLLLQGDGTHAYVRPTNVNSNLFLGTGNSNYMTIDYTGNVAISGPTLSINSIPLQSSRVVYNSVSWTNTTGPVWNSTPTTFNGSYYKSINFTSGYVNNKIRGTIVNLTSNANKNFIRLCPIVNGSISTGSTENCAWYLRKSGGWIDLDSFSGNGYCTMAVAVEQTCELSFEIDVYRYLSSRQQIQFKCSWTYANVGGVKSEGAFHISNQTAEITGMYIFMGGIGGTPSWTGYIEVEGNK